LIEDVQNKELWLLAYAAFLASMTTLFGKRAHDWIFAPELKVAYVHDKNYVDTPKPFVEVDGKLVAVDCYYFSLLVSNGGHSSADSVEVFATNLMKWDGENQNWTPERRYSMDLKWAWLGVTRLPTLAPEMDRFCNIGHIIDPAWREKFRQEDLPDVGRDTAIFSLDLEAQPNHGIHLLEPGKYHLTIKVVAANHRPITRTLEIDVKGTWYPNNLQTMLQQGITIELL